MFDDTAGYAGFGETQIAGRSASVNICHGMVLHPWVVNHSHGTPHVYTIDDIHITKPYQRSMYPESFPYFPWTHLHLTSDFPTFSCENSAISDPKWPWHPSGTGTRAPSPASHRNPPAERRGRLPPPWPRSVETWVEWWNHAKCLAKRGFSHLCELCEFDTNTDQSEKLWL